MVVKKVVFLGLHADWVSGRKSKVGNVSYWGRGRFGFAQVSGLSQPIGEDIGLELKIAA
ncbi:hypothetical protein HPP92_010773 [Vanilla planifolia]|uniref:Uncharacterized protein n=1 Tax=Vanilla planifolia TaxID=51239 RepID=A0A835R1L3_VANPL|nr:hypothetical protein HPP92_010773 [Vanilla planifolia]